MDEMQFVSVLMEICTKVDYYVAQLLFDVSCNASQCGLKHLQ